MTRAELLSVAKPILFNTQMVRAILEDRKTVTRRVIKPQPRRHYRENCECKGYFDMGGNAWACMQCGGEVEPITGKSKMKSPYWCGDILFVRETWCWCPCWDCGMNTENGCCDDTANRFYNDRRKETGCYGYRASFETGELPFDKWHPSIHMPKEAARLFLRVTEVRVERLQDITPEQCCQEGLSVDFPQPKPAYLSLAYAETRLKPAIKSEFAKLWDSTIKPADLSHCGWDANPWVWAIEFERCEPTMTEHESEGKNNEMQ